MSYPKLSYYKYRPLYADKSRGIPNQYTRAAIEASEIYYATPKDLNDPFDCNLKLHANDSPDTEWEGYIDNLIIKYPAREAQLRQIKHDKSWLSHPELRQVGKINSRTIYEESSVFCLSKKPNSIPMFSYYADEHRGLALEFSFSDIEVPCGIPFGDINTPDSWYDRKVIFRDVEYQSHFPELNYIRLNGFPQLTISLMFTKYIEWCHEEEFRIFRRKVPASTVVYDKRLLTRIILGARTEDKDIDLLKSWLHVHPTPVILSKAVPSTSSFDLFVNDVEVFKP